MSWHFSLALEEAFSAASCLVGAQSARWNSMPSAPDDSCSARMKDTCHHSPFGMMYVPSTDAHGEALLTWFRAAFPVRISVRLDAEKALMATTLGCGERWLGSFRKPSHSLYSSRIHHIYALADLSESSRTLTAWGTTRRGVCLERTTVWRRTPENGCGSLPTLTTVGNEMSPSMMKWPVHRRLAAFLGQSKPPTSQSSRPERPDSPKSMSNTQWLMDAFGCVKLPTPTATLAGYHRGGAAGRTGPIRPTIDTMTGGVSICFREWMMGWPIGWTASKQLETDKFQQWYNWHGTYLDPGPRRKQTE